MFRSLIFRPTNRPLFPDLGDSPVNGLPFDLITEEADLGEWPMLSVGIRITVAQHSTGTGSSAIARQNRSK
jgi:hypothetical protein